jgi:anti-repressor protein
LRDKSYLGTKGEYRNLPTQKAMNLGLFKIKKSTKELNNGSILLCTTTTVTAKGQIYFINKFLDRKKKRLLRKNKNPQKNKPDLLF